MALVLIVGPLAAAEVLASQAPAAIHPGGGPTSSRKSWRSPPIKLPAFDKIFESARPELRLEMDELVKYDTKLQFSSRRQTDEALLARQIDRVETARANLNKTRSLMIARMRLVLNPDQRVKLKSLYERWERQNQTRKPGSSDRPDPSRPSDPGKQPGSESRNRPGC